MFCWRCGNEVVDEAYICPNCGCLVGGRAAVEEVKYKNGIAVAGFICSFFIPLLGWIFGGIGLSRAKKRNGKGGGLSAAAITIASIMFIINLSRML